MGTQVTLRKVTSKKKKKIYIQYGGGHYDVLLRVLCSVVCARTVRCCLGNAGRVVLW